MDQPQPDWPATRWMLSAPETYVLDYAGDGRGLDVFKLAVKELVARGALRVEPVEVRGRRGAPTERSAIIAGPRAGMRAESALGPVLALFVDVDKRPLQAREASAADARASRWGGSRERREPGSPGRSNGSISTIRSSTSRCARARQRFGPLGACVVDNP